MSFQNNSHSPGVRARRLATVTFLALGAFSVTTNSFAAPAAATQAAAAPSQTATDGPKRCAKWEDIGLPLSGERVTVVKPAYDARIFADRIAQIPRYEPSKRVSGRVRLVGSDYVGSSLADWWREGFNKHQPNVKVEHDMRNVLISMPSLALGTADVGVGRGASWSELFMFQRVFFYPPTPIAMGTGAWDASFAIFVSKDNPIEELTLEQLDGILFTERSGAYAGTQWRPDLGRGPERNIRTWGQLGLTGEWKDKPIRLHGSIINAFFMRTVERRVARGEGVTWNPGFQQYETCVADDGERWYRQDQVSSAVGDDKFSMGLAYQQFGHRTDLKVLKIAATRGGPAVPLTLETLYNRSYPLSGAHPMYINRRPGTVLDPALKEYLRYILSREGQELVARHGKYLPLTPEMVQAELRKLD